MIQGVWNQEDNMHNASEYAGLMPIFRQYRIERVAIFGSRARGDNNSESDYDFLVDFSPKASLLDWGGLVEDLMSYYGRDVDVPTGTGSI